MQRERSIPAVAKKFDFALVFGVVPIRHPWAFAFALVIEKELCLGGGEEKATEINDLVITGSTVGDGNTMRY